MQLLPGYPEAEQQRAESVGQGRAHLRWGSGCAGCGRAGAFGAGAAGLGAALCPLCLLWVVCLFVFSPLLPLTGSLRAGARLAGAALPSSRDAPPASRRPGALRARRGLLAPRPARRRPAARSPPAQPPIAGHAGGPGGPSARGVRSPAAPQGAPGLRGRGGRGQGWPGERLRGSRGARRHMGSRGPPAAPRRRCRRAPGGASRVAAGAPRERWARSGGGSGSAWDRAAPSITQRPEPESRHVQTGARGGRTGQRVAAGRGAGVSHAACRGGSGRRGGRAGTGGGGEGAGLGGKAAWGGHGVRGERGEVCAVGNAGRGAGSAGCRVSVPGVGWLWSRGRLGVRGPCVHDVRDCAGLRGVCVVWDRFAGTRGSAGCWGECAQGMGERCCVFSGVHKEAERARSVGECAWRGMSIHQVWSECARRESAPGVGEGTGCGVMVHGIGECVWDMGECAQHA